MNKNSDFINIANIYTCEKSSMKSMEIVVEDKEKQQCSFRIDFKNKDEPSVIIKENCNSMNNVINNFVNYETNKSTSVSSQDGGRCINTAWML